MRIGSAIASGTRHIVGVSLQALLMAAIITALVFAAAAVSLSAPAGGDSVFAAKGGNGGGDSARGGVTITFAGAASLTTAAWPAAGDAVYFQVGTDGVKDRDLATLWVANKCSQEGTLVYAEYQAVHDGLAGPFALSWGGGGALCTAYVWTFPSSESPLKGASMDYTAN